MKKPILPLFLFLLLFQELSAQNLVPNPSFEDYTDCPTGFMELPTPTGSPTSVTDWYRPSEATSDYFNTCATGSSAFMSVPANFAGTQTPRTGDAYTGGYCYLFATEDYDYREYIESKLLTPLVAGHHYHVSYWTSLAEWSGEFNLVGIDQMGAYFSTLAESSAAIEAIDWVTPQVVSPTGTMFTDTEGWSNVSGIYTASGGEEWMTLGNFTPLSSLNIEVVSGDPSMGYGYYYFDDVCVVDMDGPPASYGIYDTSLCSGNEIAISGRDGVTNYLWNDGSMSKTITITEPGNYWVKSVDVNTCSVFADTFRVAGRVTPLPINIGKDTLVCRNMPITLNAFDPAFEEYKWNTGATTPSIQVEVAGKYYVNASSECYSGTDTIILTAPLLPKAELPQDIILCEGIPVPLRSNQLDMIYSWSTGENGCCIEINKTGDYVLTVSNICGDQSTDEIKITYSGCDNCIIEPNAFSPNGDGLNDQFKVIVNCLMQTYRLNIFNRWGQLVFSSAKVDDSWDGTYQGTPAEVGTYFYYIEATPLIKEIGKISKKGDITLVR